VLDASVLERLKLTCLLVRDAETWRAQGVTVPRSLLARSKSCLTRLPL
jgi:hypothetical protein